MNDISAILAKIDADARDFCEKTEAKAREKAKSIEEACLREGKKEAEDALEAARRQAEAIRQRAVSQAGIETRNQKLSVRRGGLDGAFQKALEKLSALPREEKAALYVRLAAESLTGDAKLILNREDREAMGEEVAQKAEELCRSRGKNHRVLLSEETGSFAGGFILDEGSTETNCTFEVLSMGVKEELEAQVASVLFG